MEIIRGSVRSPESTKMLLDFFSKYKPIDGYLYLGYPLISGIEDNNSIDALLISPTHGLVIFDIVESTTLEDRTLIQDNLFNLIYSKLLKNINLVKKRGELKVDLEVVTVAPWKNSALNNQEAFNTYLDSQEKIIEDSVFHYLVETIQSVTALKKRIKRNILKTDSRGDILKRIEESIANLDSRQSRAVIETVNGIQRIRGLAGSGKTIILALKVAYLHSLNRDWLIGVTFKTRSLKNQFRELITKFTIENIGEEPDWEKIRIIQAWGSQSNSGIYYEFCTYNNIEYLNYGNAKTKSGIDKDEFAYACKLAISEAGEKNKEVYDAILVDEAQDFDESFLKICYKMLKPADEGNIYNKRLVYAYDELQKLNEVILSEPKEIFGNNIDFKSDESGPRQDIILEKCYRNSKPVLVTAHALGFGIYRKDGLVQMFKEKEIWRDVGYDILSGKLDFSEKISLGRGDRTSPDFLCEGIKMEDLIIFEKFEDDDSQSIWIANQIEKNINEDELKHEDIIIICCDSSKVVNKTAKLRSLLFDKNINSHVAGISTSPDDFYNEKSIVVTTIYRAKGNEAAMIYVMGADYCYGGSELIKKRNILFTAITRSKAWVRVTGVGDEMNLLLGEYDMVKENNYQLNFTFLSEEEEKKLNLIHRDLTSNEKSKIEKTKKSLDSIISNLKLGKINKEDIPKETREAMIEFFREKKDEDK